MSPTACRNYEGTAKALRWRGPNFVPQSEWPDFPAQLQGDGPTALESSCGFRSCFHSGYS
jgi:hypothetical protein